jgi:hypothetical protein
MATKIRSTPSFGGEVKTKAACRNILWHVKSLASMNTNTAQGQINYCFRSFLLLVTRCW